MGEQFDGWTWLVEDAYLLFTGDDPDWLRPKYVTRTAEEEPCLTPEQETDLMNEQIDASQGFDIDFKLFRCFFNYHPVDFDDNDFVEEPETNLDLLKRLSQKSIDNYNQEHGTEYEFSEVLYANYHMSAGVMFLITFQVKDPANNLTKDFQARIRYSFVSESNFVFCRPKSDQEDSTDEAGVAEKDVKKPRLE